MNRIRSQVVKAKQKGYNAADVAYMRAVAQKEAQKMEQVALEKAFLYMLAIPLNVLANDYWEKSAKQKLPKFIEQVASLFDSVQEGTVSEQELADLLYDLAGVKIEAEWMKKNE